MNKPLKEFYGEASEGPRLGKFYIGRSPWREGYVRMPKSPPTRAEYDAADLIIGLGVGLDLA